MSTTGRKRARSIERRIRLHFLGAARTVTGSLHLFEYSDNGRTVRFFIDAGLNQESPGQNFQNRLPAGVKASDLSFGIFTHAHIDHTGFFPRLIKDGFKGVVYATHATKDLTAILLPDSGFLQEQDAKRVNARNDRQQTARAANPKAPNAKAKKKPSRHAAAPAVKAPVAVRRVEPLYTEAEGKAAIQRIVGVDYDKPLNLAEGVVATFSHASHLLGAAVVSLEIGTGSKKRRIVFTGDLGRPGMPIIKNLAPVKQADYLISEGTYGDKLHERRDRQTAFAEVIRQAYERAKRPDGKFGHGVIVIPAFAVGRVQSVLFDLRQLMLSKRIPQMPVVVDSPMAIKATEVFRKHADLYNPEAQRLSLGGDLFTTPEYAEIQDWKQSVKLDEPTNRPTIVVGSSGMASGGRIMRHLQNRLPGKNNTIVFIGYQGMGTLGRQLVTPEVRDVRVAGQPVRVRATVTYLKDYSGHADYEDILRWMSAFQRKPSKMFLVHGEQESLEALKTRIEGRLHTNVTIPKCREYVDLD